MIFSIQSTCLLWRVGKRESERPAAARSKELGSQNENGLNLKLKTLALRLGSIIIHFIPNLKGVIISLFFHSSSSLKEKAAKHPSTGSPKVIHSFIECSFRISVCDASIEIDIDLKRMSYSKLPM